LEAAAPPVADVLATGIALVFGYALLGAGWLILKTEGSENDIRAADSFHCK
jgi:cytochrome bd-type quinol oxidase subunit 2